MSPHRLSVVREAWCISRYLGVSRQNSTRARSRGRTVACRKARAPVLKNARARWEGGRCE
eukprot:6207904-Pleurochrysis_carterae.AAC.3